MIVYIVVGGEYLGTLAAFTSKEDADRCAAVATRVNGGAWISVAALELDRTVTLHNPVVPGRQEHYRPIFCETSPDTESSFR